MTGTRGASLPLRNGSRVGVIGGGPAGSLFAYFLLSLARQVDLRLEVDIYEPRDFTRAGPGGCNMCGGIVSESMIHALAAEGIQLPGGVVRRTIDSYVLHTDSGSLKIDAPRLGKTTAAVQRGGGPGGLREVARGGLDSHLLALAQDLGARVEMNRVRGVGWDGSLPQVRLQGTTRSYDLLVGATGVNSAGWQLFEQLGLRGLKPVTTKAYIAEVNLGRDAVAHHFGNSMHILLLNLPRLSFAALIPKGEFLTVVLLGREVTSDLVLTFFASPAMERCLPGGWNLSDIACHCSPRINLREAETPYRDRIVLVGDCGVTRLYKDGLGAAYHTAKAAAAAAVLYGVGAADFRNHFWPVYRSIARDNRFGSLIFSLVERTKGSKPLVEGILRMAAREQRLDGPAGRMSTVLWDMFTGSASYRNILSQMVAGPFVGRYLLETGLALGGSLYRAAAQSERDRLLESYRCPAALPGEPAAPSTGPASEVGGGSGRCRTGTR